MTQKKVAAKRHATKPTATRATIEQVQRCAALGAGASKIRDGIAIAAVLREQLTVTSATRDQLDAFDAAMRLLRDGAEHVEGVAKTSGGLL